MTGLRQQSVQMLLYEMTEGSEGTGRGTVRKMFQLPRGQERVSWTGIWSRDRQGTDGLGEDFKGRAKIFAVVLAMKCEKERRLTEFLT